MFEGTFLKNCIIQIECSRNFYFLHRYAITRLNQAPDDDLLLYLLQLVQALKYENFDNIPNKDKEILKSIDDNGCDQSFISDSTSTPGMFFFKQVIHFNDY